MNTTTTHLSNAILNKINVQPTKNTNSNCYNCYKCSNKKPKCVCWI